MSQKQVYHAHFIIIVKNLHIQINHTRIHFIKPACFLDHFPAQVLTKKIAFHVIQKKPNSSFAIRFCCELLSHKTKRL